MADNGTFQLWEKIKSLVDNEIDKRTRSCCRMKSMVVSSAYDSATQLVGVKEAFGREISIPVCATVDTNKLSVGTAVWVLAPYGSMSNAMVFMLGSVSEGASGGGTEIAFATKTQAGIMQVGDNLKVNDSGVVSVDTATDAEEDNTKPITSAAVHTVVGNVETILSTI